MALKPVAVEADVSLAPAGGESPFTGFDPEGEWNGVLTVLTYPHLTSDGAAVAWKATAQFIYTGVVTGAGSPSPSAPVSVELVGSSDPLVATQPVLRDGDSAEDPLYGNAIEVSASGPLKSD